MSKLLLFDYPDFHVDAICLPEDEPDTDEHAGQTAIATGFELTSNPSDVSSLLLKTNLIIVKQNVCKQENSFVTDVICVASDGHANCRVTTMDC